MKISTVLLTAMAAFLLHYVPLSARSYQLGYCQVRSDATGPNNMCVPYRGKKASGVAPGTSHGACTAAKARARDNLLLGIPAVCGAFIDCGGPCRTIQKD
jgi:hypothetical protein